MANDYISQVTLPNGATYDFAARADNVLPIDTKTYTNVIATANDQNGAGFFYAKIRATAFNVIWHTKFRVTVYVPGQNNYHAVSIYEVWGMGDTYMSYKCQNAIRNTSYRPVYYNTLFRAKEAGYNSNLGNWAGFSLFCSAEPTNANYKRTVQVELLEYDNCTVEMQNSLITPTNIPSRNTTNYVSTNTSYDNFDFYTNGLRETGDDTANDTDRTVQELYYFRYRTGAAGVGRYTLLMEESTGVYSSITTTFATKNDPTTRSNIAMNTGVKYRPDRILYFNQNADRAANTNIGNNAQYFTQYDLIDLRYTFKLTAGSLTAYQPFYMVGTLDDQGLFTIADADNAWTQTLPSSANGKVYIFLGMVYPDNSTYRIEFELQHPIYAYKNGALRIIQPGDASTVNGLTVQTAVPQNAIFTDHYAWGDITGKPTSIALTGAVTASATTLSSGAISIATTANHSHGNITNGGLLGTANRLVWTNGDKKVYAGYHYATTDKIAINSTSAPSYNLYVNGTSYLNGNNIINGTSQINNILTLYRETTTSANNPARITFTVKDTDKNLTSTAYIAVYNDHATTYNSNMVISSSGGTFVGAGESATTIYAALGSTTSTENLYLSADSSLFAYAYADTAANRTGFVINTSGHILPQKADAANNNKQNLGASNNVWATVYGTTFDGSILKLHQGAGADPSLTGNARIEFDYTGGQPVVISYTPNDSYRNPAGLKVMGGTSATPAWFEVEGTIYAAGFSGSGASLTSLNASNISSGTLAIARISDGSITNAKLANSKITIAGNEVSLGGSVTLANMGLSTAMHFIGVATTAITDGGTEDPTISGYTVSTDRKAGDVVIDKDSSLEYVWSTTGKWERLGGDSSYKITQTAFTNSTGTADSTNTSTTFIYSFSQTANGNITDIKTRALPTASTSTAGIIKIGTGSSNAMAGNTTVNKVKTTVKTDNVNYKILASAAGASPTSGTDYEAIYDTNVTVNPSTSTVNATVFNGKLTTTRITQPALTGSGTTGADQGSSNTTTRYKPAVWTFSGAGITPTDGDEINIKQPCAMHDYGTWLTLDGTTYYPVVQSNGSRGNWFSNGVAIKLYFDAGGTASVFAIGGAMSRSSITGVWRIMTSYNSNDDTTGYYHRRIYPNLKAGGAIHPYSIIMQLPNGRWSGITTTPPTNPVSGTISPVATGKNMSTSGYRLGHILIMNARATYADGNNIGTYNIWSAHSGLIDARYSFNLANSTGNGFVGYQPVYIVGTVTDGLFYLDTTKCWTQTLPTSDDGKVYIYIGDAYDWYRLTFTEDKPIYWYKNGAVRLFTDSYTANADGSVVSIARNTDTTIATINGKTLKIKIPASDNTWRPVGTGATDAAAGNHAHGNITNGGCITTAITKAKDDYLIIGDNSDSGKLGKGPVFCDTISSQTTSSKFLREDGTWSAPSYISNAAYGNITTSGTIGQTSGWTLANGDGLVVFDSSNSNKLERTGITFDASTETECLTKKGTWKAFNNYSLPTAKNDTLGGVKPWYSHTAASTGPTTGSNATAITVNAIQTTSGRYYAVEADSNGRLFVNVPWTNVNSSYLTSHNNLVKQTSKTDNVKYKLLASAQASPTSGTAYEAVYDAKIYINPSLNQVSAGAFMLHDMAATPLEKVKLEWNSTDQSLDFIFG